MWNLILAASCWSHELSFCRRRVGVLHFEMMLDSHIYGAESFRSADMRHFLERRDYKLMLIIT